MKTRLAVLITSILLGNPSFAEEKKPIKLSPSTAPAGESETDRLLRDPKAAKGLAPVEKPVKYSCIDSSGAPINADNPRFNQCIEENSKKGTVRNPVTGATQMTR